MIPYLYSMYAYLGFRSIAPYKYDPYIYFQGFFKGIQKTGISGLNMTNILLGTSLKA